MLIHLEKKPPKRRLTEKQRQSIMGLCIALGALLVTLCVVILIRMDRKKDDSILKLAEVEDYTQYTEEEFREITDNDEAINLGWFYYNLDREEKEDILRRFPYLNSETIQSFSYVPKEEVTDDMEVIGTDTYNDTDKLLVREYVSPINVAKEYYDDAYEDYQEARDKIEEKGEYEKVLNEHHDLIDDVSQTQYLQPQILYDWWHQAQKDEDKTKEDSIVLKVGKKQCTFYVNFLAFGKANGIVDAYIPSGYSKNAASARSFIKAFKLQAGSEDGDVSPEYNQSGADDVINTLTSKGDGAKVTIELSKNERCSTISTKNDKDNSYGDDTEPGDNGEKPVYIESITIEHAPLGLTISGYDQYLQIPTSAIDGGLNYYRTYDPNTGQWGPKTDSNGNIYYTRDVAVIDFAYQCPTNYVPSSANVTLYKYSGARFSTNTYNYAKTGSNGNANFADNASAGASTLGFNNYKGTYKNDTLDLLKYSFVNNKYEDALALDNYYPNLNENNIIYGAKQSVTSVSEKNSPSATMSQILYDGNTAEDQHYVKNTATSGNLDNFTIQINLHENTVEGAGRGEATGNASDSDVAADRFLTRAIAKNNGDDHSAILYIILGQNEEELRFVESTKNDHKNTWYFKTSATGKTEISDGSISYTGSTGTSKSFADIIGRNISNASLNDRFRLAGHKLRYISVERGNTHDAEDLDVAHGAEMIQTLPSYKINTSVFSYGIGNVYGFNDIKASLDDGTHELSEFLWTRTPVLGEDSLGVPAVGRVSVSSSDSYHFINQAFKQQETVPVSKLRFYYNNSKPRYRVVMADSNTPGENTVANAVNSIYGLQNDTNYSVDATKAGIVADAYKDGAGGYKDRKGKLKAFLNQRTTRTADIINYEENGDNTLSTYTLAIKTTGQVTNIQSKLHKWLQEVGFAVYDIEDYENGEAGIHNKIKRVGSYSIKSSDEDAIKTKPENEIKSDQLYAIHRSSNKLDDNDYFYFTRKANGNLKDQTSTGKEFEFTLMCRDRYKNDNGKHTSVKKVKIVLLFVKERSISIGVGTTVDTSHKFLVDAVKPTLNSTDHSHYTKTKTFELYKDNVRLQNFSGVGAAAELKKLTKFFDQRLSVGTYVLKSKLEFKHDTGCAAWGHTFEALDSHHPNICKVATCRHRHKDHPNFCQECCPQQAGKTKPDVNATVTITVFNDEPVPEKIDDIEKDEGVELTTDEVVAMFRASDAQDMGVHDGDTTEVANGSCDYCQNEGDYNLSGGSWSLSADSLYKVYTVYPTNASNNPNVPNVTPYIQIFVPANLSMKNYGTDTGINPGDTTYPVKMYVMDADGVLKGADGEIRIKGTIQTPPPSPISDTLVFHTNESISQSDILNNVSCKTGYGDQCNKAILDTNELYIQVNDYGEELKVMKWHTPFFRIKDLVQENGSYQDDNSVCRKANSVSTEKDHVVTVRFTHPRVSSLIIDESFHIKIVNDPPYAEVTTPYLLHVGEKWTEEMFFKWWSCNAYDFEDGNRSLTARDYDQPSRDTKIRHEDEHKKYQIDKTQRSYNTLADRGLINDGDTYLHRFHITDWAGYQKYDEESKTYYFNTDNEVDNVTLQAVYYDEDGASYEFPLTVKVQKQGIPTPTPNTTPGTSESPTSTPSGDETPDPNTTPDPYDPPSRQPVTPGPGIPTQTDHPIESEGPKPTKPSVTTDPNTPTNKPSESYTDSKQYKTRYISKDFIDELPEYGGLAYDNTWSRNYSEAHNSENFNTLWNSLHKNVDDSNNTNDWEGCQFVFVFDKEDIKEYQDMIYNYAVTGEANGGFPTWDFNDALWDKMKKRGNIKHTTDFSHKCVYVTEQTRPATCVENGAIFTVCKTCGSTKTKKILQPLGHSWVETSVGAGNCTEVKTTTKRCSRCNTEETTTSGGQGHQMTVIKTVPVTCAQDGYTLSKCDNCDYTEESNRIPATGIHDWEEQEKKEPTCTNEGYIKYQCSVCEEEKWEDKAKLEHNFADPVNEPATRTNCEQIIYKVSTCKTCGYEKREILSPADTHETRDWNEYPTCEEDGSVKQVCTKTNCDHESEPETVSKLGHTTISKDDLGDGYWYKELIDDPLYSAITGTVFNEDNSVKTLAQEGENYVFETYGRKEVLHTITKKSKCVFKTTKTDGKATGAELTEEKNGLADVFCARNLFVDDNADGYYDRKTICGKTLKTDVPFYYDHSNIIEEKTVAPTCTEYGYTYKRCPKCEVESEHYNLVPPTHDYNYEGDEAANYTGTVHLVGGDFTHAGQGYQEKTVNGVVWADVLFNWNYQVCRKCGKHIRWQPTTCVPSGHGAGWGNTYNDADFTTEWPSEITEENKDDAEKTKDSILCGLGLHDYATETQSDVSCTTDGYLKLKCQHSGCSSVSANYQKTGDKSAHAGWSILDLANGLIPSDYIGGGVKWKDYMIYDGNAVCKITVPSQCNFVLDYDVLGNPVGARNTNTEQNGKAELHCRYCDKNILNVTFSGDCIEEKTVHEWDKTYSYQECSACGEKSGNYNISSGLPGLYNFNHYKSWDTLIDEGIITVNALNIITGVDSSRLNGKLRIPDTVIGINDNVFSGCSSLDTVDIPGYVQLGEKAFRNCANLKSVSLGDVSYVPDGAFQDCCALEAVSLPDTITSIGKDAFRSCTQLSTGIDFSSYTNLTTIGDYAFYHCKKLTMEFSAPDSLTSIGKNAFDNCGFSKISLNSHVNANEEAFIYCDKATSINVWCNVSNKMFMGCYNAKYIMIAGNAQTIGFMAFAGAGTNAGGIEYIAIRTNVSSIEAHAFQSINANRLQTISNSLVWTSYTSKELFINALRAENPSVSIDGTAFSTLTVNP